MQTITLNTGYDHPSQHKYNPVGPLDAFWTVVQDPSPSTQEPRPANTINKHPAWSAAQGESQWISYSQSGSAPAPVKGTYVYQKCFCLTKALWENPDTLRRSTAGAPLRRIGEPDEIAGAAVFLAAPAGAFMTGQKIVIDGGVIEAGGGID